MGSKNNAADIVFYRDAGKPYIVVECKTPKEKFDDRKHWEQLNSYFCLQGGTKFGILTNGVLCRFYGKSLTADKDTHRMEGEPFFEFDITNPKDSDFEALQYFQKTAEPGDTLNAAMELRLQSTISRNIRKAMEDPSKGFIDMLTEGIASGKWKKLLTEKSPEWIQATFRQIIDEKASEEIRSERSAKDSAIDEAVLARTFLGAIQGILLEVCESKHLDLYPVAVGDAVCFKNSKNPVIYLIKRGGKIRFGLGKSIVDMTSYP